jgi:hypothetical protein
MNEIRIERVPIPDGPTRGPARKYPWERLQVGDSFWVPTRSPLVSSRRWAEQKLGIKVISKAEDGGRRFFRVA